MTSNETIVENLRIMKREQDKLNNNIKQLADRLKVVEEMMMDAVVDFKSYQIARAKEAIPTKRRKKPKSI